MKTVICGVWHVHAPEYTDYALRLGQVLGFYEEDDALAAAYQARYGLPRFATLEDMLASDAEGVIVCSATSDHVALMVKIAAAGKHIFTEKVLALSTEDCLTIEKAVRENGVQFVISLFQKSLASRRAVKQVADSGELGKINYLRFRNCHSGSTKDWLPPHFYNEQQCGGGAMIDLGAHGMYLAHWILGLPAAAASAFTVSHENSKNSDGVEDNAVTIMTYPDGAIAVNETGFVSNYAPVVFEVSGEEGYVRMVGNSVVKCTAATEGKEVEVELGEDIPRPIEQFLVDGAAPECDMEVAKALTRMMEMAYAGKM